MTYPSGKGNCFREIINLMPPHRIYVEPFFGGGSVFFHKFPAHSNHLNDIDPFVVDHYRPKTASLHFGLVSWSCCDVFELLESLSLSKSMLIYLDPPYLPETRRTGRIYQFEFSRSQHVKLVDFIQRLSCMVIISGYPNSLYDEALSSWNKHQFTTPTRGGTLALECAWYNFEKPVYLHDYSYVGSDFRKREIIKRQKKRWLQKLKRLDPVRRHSFFLSMLQEFHFEIKFLQDNHF